MKETVKNSSPLISALADKLKISLFHSSSAEMGGRFLGPFRSNKTIIYQNRLRWINSKPTIHWMIDLIANLFRANHFLFVKQHKPKLSANSIERASLSAKVVQ